MRFNNFDSNALGELVKKVAVLEGVVTSAIAKQKITVTPIKGTFASSAEAVNKGGRKIKCAVRLVQEGKLIPYDGVLTVGVVNSGSGTNVEITKVVVEKGYGEFEVKYTGTWASADTCIITVGEGDTILGETLQSGQIIDTFGA